MRPEKKAENKHINIDNYLNRKLLEKLPEIPLSESAGPIWNKQKISWISGGIQDLETVIEDLRDSVNTYSPILKEGLKPFTASIVTREFSETLQSKLTSAREALTRLERTCQLSRGSDE